ncbi:putative glutamyl endopeptidase, chloroplastic [Paramyrothecium foliicola]|nr:putative glutamyl endopeptidase, chloroplastic [Paramyrothecium foliicola]
MSTTNASPSGYSRPPKAILDVMRAPSPPVPSVSPTGDRMIMVHWQAHPPIERMANPFLRLAGIRIEPHNRSKRDGTGGHGIVPSAIRYDLVDIASGTQTRVDLPEGSQLSSPIWNADGKYFAFRNTTRTSVELWIGDGRTAATRRVPSVHLNQMLGDDLQWMPDQRTLLTKLVPNKMGAPPTKTEIATGPSIQETHGEKGQSSTYEARDTLTCPHDEDVFDYYAASQLALIDAASLDVQNVGNIDRYVGLNPSPNGKHVLVTKIRKPYSYVTTSVRFPRNVDVWDISDISNIAIREIASIPLADRVPIHGVRLGPREFSWRATAPATLLWVEALDGGNWNVEATARDKLMKLEAPFDSEATEIARTQYRYGGIRWTERSDLTMLMEYDRNKHWRRVFLFNIEEPEKEHRLLWSFSMHEQYKHPGTPVFRRLANGSRVMRLDGDSVFLTGDGSSIDGDRPFLDRLDLRTLTTKRLFRCDKSCYEYFIAFDREDNKSFLTRRQSVEHPPNVFRRTISDPIDDVTEGEAAYDSGSAAITHVSDPTPIVRQIGKRLVTYKRKDGLELSFLLLTPPGYQKGVRVPTILYAYPRDYAEASTAGQVTGSQALFTRLAKYTYLLLAGYAIIDKVSFPIIGDPKTAYDTYLEQLVANAEAAVEEVVRLGVADPDRIGVTGHSHGALMTANLLAHSSLFRAGVATSGSYNKTFTPFGFQNERRTMWDAQEVYLKASAHVAADKIKNPLLIMHGADDANSGTRPFQSNLLYEAIRGNGGTARLVHLPHEPHWYTAQESNEHVVHEMLTWFDKHVKNRGKL